jgi:hypothetical protein
MSKPIFIFMRRFILVLACSLAVVPAAGAITGGQLDGSAHPYVGIAGNGTQLCSGFLVSPTVWVTAAHCFVGVDSIYGTAPDGAPLVKGTFDPRGITVPSSERVNFFGAFYPNPAYCASCSKSGHDFAVVVLTAPVAMPRYASLPSRGLVDSLANGTALDLVGYGYQDLKTGARGSRYAAPSELANAGTSFADDLIKLASSRSAGNGGFCFGDSGGPDLLAGTDVAIAVNTFVMNDVCRGVTYSTRLDTPDALAFVRSFLG